MYFAVSGLSPVTITVLTPIFRNLSNLSDMPGFIMSCNSITPLIVLFAATTKGVPPLVAINLTASAVSMGMLLPASSAILFIESKAPFKILSPLANSIPLERVSAVNFIKVAPSVFKATVPLGNSSFASSTIDFPSGVSSGIEVNKLNCINSNSLIPALG